MVGSFFALLAAIIFSLNNIIIRRAVLKVSDASIGTLITVPMAVLFFFFILVFTGELRSIVSFPWQGYVWFSLAGIAHFVVGRSLIYELIQIVGANIAAILRRANILITVVIGITVLHEPVSWQLLTGVFLIVVGITLPGLNSQTIKNDGFAKSRKLKICQFWANAIN